MKKFAYLGALIGSSLLLAPLAADSYNSTMMQAGVTDTYATSSDRQLLANIRSALGSNGTYSNVTINVTNGVVTLTGLVNAQSDAKNLAKTVTNVQGVQSVNNNVQVSQNGTMNNDTWMTASDHQIAMDVRDQLTSMFNSTYKNVSLDVTNGVVTLQGFVNNSSDAQNAVKKATTVQGVKSVVSRLQVKAG